jgi:uncharacterized protein (TIGR01777 family)
MKIIIAGGSGQVGTILCRAFHNSGDEVVSLSRSPRSTPWKTVQWDARTLGPWTSELDGADFVINLAGRSVNCRYGKKNRRDIIDSRVDSTRVIGEAIAACARPPRAWLQASTATIYAHRYDAANTESTGILGGNEPGVPETWCFSIDVAKAWELATVQAETPHTRKILLRSAIIMSPDQGGAFDMLLRLVRFGLGGTEGDGRQFVSWIHESDFIRAIRWIIEHDGIEGPINLAAPNPLPNREFLRDLRTAWKAPFGLPATKWMLELGAIALRTETELILKSRRVFPERLIVGGFHFEFPDWKRAAEELCASWKKPLISPSPAHPARSAASAIRAK